MNLTQLALKFRTTVYVAILFIVIAGVSAYSSLPLEAHPDVKIPIMLVSTIYPGVSPEDMERLVTNELESELKNLKDVKKMTSSSAESVSTVSIEFESGTDLDMAYQRVRDKVDKAKPDLPVDAEDPIIIEINISEFPIVIVNLSGPYDLDRLKTVAEGLQNKIEQIPGVLEANITGGLDREIQVYLDPGKMEYYKLGVDQVIHRIQQEHRTTPAGNLELGGNKYSVRIPGEYKDVKLMEDIVLKAPGGRPILLKDVGRVVDGFRERETISRMNGVECVTLSVKKRSGENVVRIVDEMKEILETEASTFPPGTSYSIRQDESEYIKNIVSDLENNIIAALILVLTVLLFSLGMRNAFFVAIAIPLSMLLSFAILQSAGITLNMVVLFSLILALGMLVDNSIVVVENIYRHVSEGKTRLQAAAEATKEVAWPIIASTATTVAVFFPLLFWPGIMGEFMFYLPLTAITVLCSSLFVALVINPVVASGFLKAKQKSMFDDSGQAKGVVLRNYQRVLRFSLNYPLSVLSFFVVILFTVVLIFAKVGTGIELFPETTPERAQATVSAPQGINLEATDALTKQVETIATAQDNAKTVIANVGVGAGFFSGKTTNKSVVNLEFVDRHERSHSTWDTIKSIRDKLGDLAGAEYRVDVERMGPPTGAAVSVEISGPDFDVINKYVAEVKELLRSIDGVVDIKDDYESGKPEIRIEIDRQKAMLHKVNTETVSTAVRAAINGIEASVLREGDEEYDIVVRYDERFRQSINDVLDIRVTGKDDVQIPLRDVAKVTTVGGFGSIKHIDQKRTVAVTSDVSGRSSAEVMQDVRKLITSKIQLPAEYAIAFSGEEEHQKEAKDFLGDAFMAGIMLIAIILITEFNSVFRPAIILASVLMSLVGVFLGLIITGNKFGIIMTGVGVISLAGVVVNNAIVLIDYTDQLKDKLGLPLKEALARAGVVRFRPVLLTAITTILGVTPMAVGFSIDFKALTIDIGGQSVEWWGPMAQAVAFGLTFATVLTLIVVPVMYIAQDNLVNFSKRMWIFLTQIGRSRKQEESETSA
jgi:multidrug efflux pump